MIRFALIALLLLAACPKDSTEPSQSDNARAMAAKVPAPAVAPGATPAPATDVDWTRASVGALVELGEAVAANKDDCDKMGAAMTTSLDKNSEILTRYGQEAAKHSPDELKKLNEPYAQTMQGVFANVQRGARCYDTPSVKAAKDRLSTFMK